MLQLTVALGVDSWPWNMIIFTLSKNQPKKVVTKGTMVTKVSFKIRSAFLKYDKIIMVLEQQSATARVLVW